MHALLTMVGLPDLTIAPLILLLAIIGLAVLPVSYTHLTLPTTPYV